MRARKKSLINTKCKDENFGAVRIGISEFGQNPTKTTWLGRLCLACSACWRGFGATKAKVNLSMLNIIYRHGLAGWLHLFVHSRLPSRLATRSPNSHHKLIFILTFSLTGLACSLHCMTAMTAMGRLLRMLS